MGQSLAPDRWEKISAQLGIEPRSPGYLVPHVRAALRFDKGCGPSL